MLPNTASLSSYGQPKTQDYEPEDPTTEEAASDRNAYVADVAAMTQTVDRAWVRFIGHATTPTLEGTNGHGAVWGNGLDVLPEPAKTGTGVYTITWPSTITDENANEIAVSLKHATPAVEGSTPYIVTAEVTAPSVVTFYVFTHAGVADNGAGVTFLCRAG